MALLDIIEEQSVFAFTGKINVMLHSNKRLVGSIFMHEGNVVNASHDKNSGMNALNYYVFEDFQKTNVFDFIIEPEIIPKDKIVFSTGIAELKNILSRDYENYKKVDQLRPPGHIKLLVSADYLDKVTSVTPEEFDLLGVISDHGVVDSIYKHSPFAELKTTELLVSFKKNSVIRVIK